MNKREEGLVEIYNRIKVARVELGIVQFRRSPTTTLDKVPMCIMLEDMDEILKRPSRGRLSYPCLRNVDIILELAVNENVTDIRSLILDLRRVVFAGGITVAEKTIIEELRLEGPFGYGVPDILGMRLILGMVYTDDGILS